MSTYAYNNHVNVSHVSDVLTKEINALIMSLSLLHKKKKQQQITTK